MEKIIGIQQYRNSMSVMNTLTHARRSIVSKIRLLEESGLKEGDAWQANVRDYNVLNELIDECITDLESQAKSLGVEFETLRQVDNHVYPRLQFGKDDEMPDDEKTVQQVYDELTDGQKKLLHKILSEKEEN